MTVVARLIITILFIAIIALGIVFFGVFGLIPSKRLTTVVEIEERKIIIPGEETAPAGSESQEVVLNEPDAPQQSNPVSLEAVPAGTIRLEMSAAGIFPQRFDAESGGTVVLSVTSADAHTHLFKFTNPALEAVAVGVGPGETRVITFNAPSSGDYEFFCDVPGHKDRGERGTMTVR